MMEIFAVLALLLLALAAASDFLYSAIPNSLSLALAAAFVGFGFATGLDGAQWLSALACGLTVLVAGFALFAFGIFGPGDAKLLAAASLWAGWHDLPILLAVMALGGAAISLPLLVSREWFGGLRRAARRALGPRLAALGLGDARGFEESRPLDVLVPYGIAISAGAGNVILLCIR